MQDPGSGGFVTRNELRLTIEAWRSEFRSFKNEQRLMLVSAVAAVAALNLAPDDALKTIGALGAMIAGLLVKVLWIRG